VELIGTVVRLQVQRSRLKPGEKLNRIYNPAPLLEVDELTITPRGVTGPGGMLDVHHADHPDTRNVKLRNGLSVMTRPRYDALRASYGPHLADGIAGESLLLDQGHDLSGPLVLETEDGQLDLDGAPAPPCVEFSRFVLGRGLGDNGPEVLAAMAALGDGARGFYLRTSGTGRVRAGARVLRRNP
jgi:hypothetical protein